MITVFFTICMSFTALGNDETPTRTVLDKIVAVVGRRVITLSDIRLENRLRTLQPSPFTPFQTKRNEPMDFLLEVQILRRLAGDVPLYRPNSIEINSRMDQLKSHWDNEDKYLLFLNQYGVTDNRLEGILITQITAEKYAQKNLGITKKESQDELFNRYVEWMNSIKINSEYRIIDPSYLGNKPELEP